MKTNWKAQIEILISYFCSELRIQQHHKRKILTEQHHISTSNLLILSVRIQQHHKINKFDSSNWNSNILFLFLIKHWTTPQKEDIIWTNSNDKISEQLTWVPNIAALHYFVLASASGLWSLILWSLGTLNPFWVAYKPSLWIQVSRKSHLTGVIKLMFEQIIRSTQHRSPL